MVQVDMLTKIDERVHELERQVMTHEAVCAERYRGILDTNAEIKANMVRTHSTLIKLGITLLVGMLGLFVKIATG